MTVNLARQELPTERGYCQWYVQCHRPAHGYILHPVLGPVLCCLDCAEKHNLTFMLKEEVLIVKFIEYGRAHDLDMMTEDFTIDSDGWVCIDGMDAWEWLEAMTS